MAIIVDNDTRLVVQGLTGSEGRFHGLRNRNYGTNVVAGVTPAKGGQDVEGIPVFNTVVEAVERAGANTTLIFVPARFAADAIYEAVDAGAGVHRRFLGAARQDDGSCRRDYLRLLRNRRGEEGGARSGRHPGRHDADRGRATGRGTVRRTRAVVTTRQPTKR